MNSLETKSNKKNEISFFGDSILLNKIYQIFDFENTCILTTVRNILLHYNAPYSMAKNVWIFGVIYKWPLQNLLSREQFS